MSTLTLEPPYQTYVAEYLTSCRECGHVSSGNDSVCEYCGSEQLEQMPQRGEIYSYTMIYREDSNDAPANAVILALVQLSSGPVVMGQIVGAGRHVDVGMAVELATSSQQQFGARRTGGLCFAPLTDNDLL